MTLGNAAAAKVPVDRPVLDCRASFTLLGAMRRNGASYRIDEVLGPAIELAPMERVRELRQKAELYRRVAGHPTDGGKGADRILVKLAEQLEREADDRLAWLNASPKELPSV
jgi:hypothetical protein